jgi:serine/threonine protein kinase
MNLEGKLLGSRYEIIEKIGNGGMATVYKAKDLVLKRYVAVKILREEYTTDNEFIKRFNTEAESAASLTHPNIVSVYDVGKEGNLYYIVMELIKGKTLKEIIVEDGRMGWKWSVKIAKQIAQALETAHRNNIIHRDIKPHNIIITEDGTAKVTDFGIAKAVSNSTITAFGTTIGSVHYFSPEHARGGYTDAKSDLYSLGVVLYEMVTGRVPFDADTPVSVALKHMQEKPVPPIELNPAIPQSLNDLILKAMEKDPNMRYSTATEMIEDLDKILKNPEAEVGVVDKSQARARRIQQEDNQTNQSKFAKFKKYLEEHKGVKIALIVAIFLIVFIASIGITLGVLNSGKPKDILLPNFTNLILDEAKAKAEEVKLNLNVSEEKYDVQIEEGKIISQDPPEGYKYQPNFTVKEGSTVNVVVSKGQEIVKVTKLVGKTKDEARKELKDLGLEMEIEEVNSDDVEPGIVIEQDKQEGEEVLAGTKIKLKVSLGIEKVEVPDLKGLSEDEAKAKITEAKLKWIRTDKIKDSSKGTGVVEQNISPKSMVDKNTEISITINEYQKITQGTINIDVAELTGYTPKYKKVEDGKDEDGKTKYKDVLIPPEKVKIKVTVNDEQVTEQEVSEDEKALQVNFDGEGTVRIKVIIDGSTKKTVDMNLNSETTKNIP